MNWLSLSLQLLEAAPKVVTAVRDVEGVLKGAKKGTAKKAIVMAAFSNAPTPLKDALGALVDDTVTALNAAGELESEPTSPPPAAA
jgi:hypothetical protein